MAKTPDVIVYLRVTCTTDAQVARAFEVLSRAGAGLMMDGLEPVHLLAMKDDEETEGQ